MAHWFHRNPLKATAPQPFEFKSTKVSGSPHKICLELKLNRARLLELIANPHNDVTTLETTAKEYFSLLHGFLTSLDPDKAGESKLRHSLRFKWTDALKGQTPTDRYDVMFEQISMLINIGLWYTKNASKVAAKEEPSEDEAKTVYRSLKKAAGAMAAAKELVPRLLESPEEGADTDVRVLEGYCSQCQAEAQEVTIARAIELKHKPALVAGLACETHRMFTVAYESLSSIPGSAKWQKYLELKAHLYKSVAYSYHAETLLAQDKCGEAIRCIKESITCFDQSGVCCREYAALKGAGTTAKPEQHLFFRKLGSVIKKTLDKCERENGLIYHQKVPEMCPALDMKATYGLAKPDEYPIPEAHTLWTAATYKEFEIATLTTPGEKNTKAAVKAEGDLPPVKEPDIPQSMKDPKNSSGCVIS